MEYDMKELETNIKGFAITVKSINALIEKIETTQKVITESNENYKEINNEKIELNELYHKLNSDLAQLVIKFESDNKTLNDTLSKELKETHLKISQTTIEQVKSFQNSFEILIQETKEINRLRNKEIDSKLDEQFQLLNTSKELLEMNLSKILKDIIDLNQNIVNTKDSISKHISQLEQTNSGRSKKTKSTVVVFGVVIILLQIVSIIIGMMG